MSSHQHSRKRQALCHLISLILPDRIARRIHSTPLTGKTPPISIHGPSSSGSRVNHPLDVLQVHRVSLYDKRHVTINILPDDVLLHVFRFVRMTYLEDVNRGRYLSWGWHGLTHVCRRWRSVVFASPNFLGLSLVCNTRRTMECTGIWPALPIIIKETANWSVPEDYVFDAVVLRVCEINLCLTISQPSSQFQQLVSATQKQFPALIHLRLDLIHRCHLAPFLPDGFLGGSAPNLRSLELRRVPFPALPNLLLSATDLVELTLRDIPHSTEYISPEAIVTGLAELVHLKSLIIGFEFPRHSLHLESRHPRLPARKVLPALTHFEFHGVGEYLEDLVARIDAPLLDFVWITFFYEPTFDILQLSLFLMRATRFQAHNKAHVDFGYDRVHVEFLPPTGTFDEKTRFRISLACKQSVSSWQVSSLSRVLTLPSIYMAEHLYISGPRYLPSQWLGGPGIQWLDFLRPFTDVKKLYVCKDFARCIEFVWERVPDVLPALESLFLEEPQQSGPIQEGTRKLVAAQQLSGHPITVSLWKRDWV